MTYGRMGASNQGGFAALDFNASRATATSPELARYRVVHFATHALINSKHPDLAGIVLSLVDRQGRPQNGFLAAHDVYNLKLGADLVVLSACRTALGKEIRGEGLVSIVRGFMYAGAPRVVASLWDVRDQAAAELMKRFYVDFSLTGFRRRPHSGRLKCPCSKKHSGSLPTTGQASYFKVTGSSAARACEGAIFQSLLGRLGLEQ